MIQFPPAPIERIEAIRQTRRVAAASLVRALASFETRPSELAVCQKWQELIRLCPDIEANGWYQPPPGGVIALIGQPDGFTRISYDSLRNSRHWPSDDIYLFDDSILYSYCSPIHRPTGMIGDIAVTLYRGKNSLIRDGLSRIMDVTARIVKHVAVGMSFSELYDYALGVIQEAGMRNFTYSVSDLHGSDIGHTVPWVSEIYPENVIAWLRNPSSTGIIQLIRDGRSFIHSQNFELIMPTAAFTLEPRLSVGDLPPMGFHVIVIIVDGVKVVCSEFKQLFELFGMDQYLPHDALEAINSF